MLDGMVALDALDAEYRIDRSITSLDGMCALIRVYLMVCIAQCFS